MDIEVFLTNSLATLSGVILSFLLWLGANRILQNKRDNKVKANMIKALKEEIEMNLNLLANVHEGIEQSLKTGTIPVYIPQRLDLSVYNYAVASGDIRLIKDFDKQRLLRLIAYSCDVFNHFSENTEFLCGIFLMRNDGLKLSVYRLTKLRESAQDHNKIIADFYHKFDFQSYLPRNEIKKTTSSKKEIQPGE
jgi:hypothetical protein